METVWFDQSCGKATFWIMEICCQKKYVARREMLPEDICCWRRNAAGGDRLPKEVSNQRGIKPKEVSSQRRYPVREETHH